MTSAVNIAGYSSQLSARAGESLDFHVSCEESTFSAEVVRLIHGDTDPSGPGFKAEPVSSEVEGNHPGTPQPLTPGSYVIVPPSRCLEGVDAGLALRTYVFPTLLPSDRSQCLISQIDAYGRGYALSLSGEGLLSFYIGSRDDHETVEATVPLIAFYWYSVAVGFDPSGSVILLHKPVHPRQVDQKPARTVLETSVALEAALDAPLLLAARMHPSRGTASDHFNGKLDNPQIYARPLTTTEVELFIADAPASRLATDEGLVADWDFSSTHGSYVVIDRSPYRHHGELVNAPARAVTGHNWTGRELDFRHAPGEYAAVHFHEDDLEDANWDVAFSLPIPESWQSGIYAVHLTTTHDEDYVPFFVRPGLGERPKNVALLIPSLTYMAYGNEHMWNNPLLSGVEADFAPESKEVFDNLEDWLSPADHYIVENKLLSLYDYHIDGTGNCIASRLRPLFQMRPDYRAITALGPHGLGADLHLVDWLEHLGYRFDVLTDEDLHADGLSSIEDYRVLLTGTHPEYWTRAMLESLELYLERGGRLMYLGGNGFYWVTSVDPERPHLIEVRRGQAGSGPWQSPVGENHHASTGEPGGLWRHRGKPPQSLVGVGFTAQGWGNGREFTLNSQAIPDNATFITDGVSDPSFGAEGLVMGAAASIETDRADAALGTPPHAIVIATATGFSDSYQAVREDMLLCDSRQGGTVSPFVRADVAYIEYPNGGAVFSVGSIGWCGCLSRDGYENAISRITSNVLNQFLAVE